jgi:hypothetical protein
MPAVRLRQTLMPKAISGWTLTNDAGQPRYWPTVWANVLKADLHESTAGRHLLGVEHFYQSVVNQTGEDCLDELIAHFDFDALEPALGGALTSLRNAGAQASVFHDDRPGGGLRRRRHVTIS